MSPRGGGPTAEGPAVDTLPGRLLAQARARGGAVALREKEHGIWREITWAEYRDRAARVAAGLETLGLRPGDRIAVAGDNRPEWVLAELGAQAAGMVPVGVYQDAVGPEVEHVLGASEARLVVAEDQEQVDKVLEIRPRLPKLEWIVHYDPRGLLAYEAPGLMGFEELEARGAGSGRAAPEAFERRIAALAPDGTALLCTTSGTTSRPKLAMLSHRNLLEMAAALRRVDPMRPEDEYLSFLPLAWIGEQMVSLSSALTVGFAVNFPEEPETVRSDLREIGPQVIFSPPRIWESFVSEVQVMASDTTPLKRRLCAWAMRVGEEAADRRLRGSGIPRSLAWKRRLAEGVALLSIKDQLGLRRVRKAYTGGAALGPDVFRFFHALGVNLKQLYGQTEVAGISALHRDGDVRHQTVGTPLPGTEIRISDEGEVLVRSASVFQGYFGDPAATAAALAGGWLRSGDAGYLDERGHLVVVDRLEDVMTLADGTTFSPRFLENKLKFSPYVGEAVVFGGEEPFVTAIVALDFETAGQWAERSGIAYTTFTDLAAKPELYGLVRAHVEEVNRDLPEAARIRRFLLLHKELHADDAELTRTRKVRRRFVTDRFRGLVEALYGEGDAVDVEAEISYQDGRTAKVERRLRIETLRDSSAAS